MQYRIILLLFAGHLMTDISQGIVPALLPYFISEYGLTYSATGFLVLALTVSSSVLQPFFGYLADRKPLPWLVASGPFLAGLGIAVAGLFHQYYLIVAGVFLCGLGVAAFHPEGARMAGMASGENKASAMSIYSVGGNAGFAMGPLIAAGLILFWGLKGIALYFIPALIMGILLFQASVRFNRLSPIENNEVKNKAVIASSSSPGQGDQWMPFVLLTLAIVCRSILMQGFNTFLPSYWIEVFHATKEEASTVLTLLLGMGVVGNLAGGRLADRFGHQKTAFVAFVLLIPQIFIFANSTNPFWAGFFLITIGFTIYITFSPMIVLGQQFLPGRVGFASGITIGLAVSVGGFAAPVLGRLADLAGVHTVFYLAVIFPVLAALLMYPLTRHTRATAS